MATTRSQSASNFKMLVVLVVLAHLGAAYFLLPGTPLAMAPQAGKSHQADPDDATCPKPNL